MGDRECHDPVGWPYLRPRALLLVLFGVIVADVLADRANAEEQAGAVGPEAPDRSSATE